MFVEEIVPALADRGVRFVTWDEVDRCAAGALALRFDSADVLGRLDALGDLFEPVLTIEQELPIPG